LGVSSGTIQLTLIKPFSNLNKRPYVYGVFRNSILIRGSKDNILQEIEILETLKKLFKLDQAFRVVMAITGGGVD
jgi:hypothetical protein